MKKFLLGICSVLLAVFVGVLPVAAEDDLLTMAQNAGYPATEIFYPSLPSWWMLILVKFSGGKM